MTKAITPIDRTTSGENSVMHQDERDVIVPIPNNCKNYNFKSLKRIQKQNRVVYYKLIYTDPRTKYKKDREYVWKRLDGDDVFNKLLSGELEYDDMNKEYRTKFSKDPEENIKKKEGIYIDFLQTWAEEMRRTDFIENGTNQDHFRSVLEVAYEQIDKDLRYLICKDLSHATFYLTDRFTPIDSQSIIHRDYYNEAWRKEELRKHPEYGKNGEKALDAILKEYDDEGYEDYKIITKSQHQIILTPDTKPEDLTDTTGYLGGNRGILIGKIGDVGKNCSLVPFAFIFCKWCFDLGYDLGDDGDGDEKEGYEKFIHPVVPEKVHWLITQFEACHRCRRKGYLEIVKPLVPTWELRLIHPYHAGTVKVKGVSVFDLTKGDIIAVKGKDDYLGSNWVRYCEELQVLSHASVRELGFNSEMLEDHIKTLPQNKALRIALESSNSLKTTRLLLPDHIDNIETKIADLFSAKCKETKSVVRLDEGLDEIYKNNDDQFRSCKIFKLDDKGKLIFGLRYNWDLGEFCRLQLDNRPFQDGIIKRVGSKPMKYKWEQTP